MGNPYETPEDRDLRGRVGAVGHRRRHLAGHRGGGRWKRPTLESGAGTAFLTPGSWFCFQVASGKTSYITMENQNF